MARIQSVEIENLRGIKSGKLEGLAPLTVLTGPNGSGKSTVLDALDIGGSPNPGAAVRDTIVRRTHVPLGGRWLFPSGLEQASEPSITCRTGKGQVRTTKICWSTAPEHFLYAMYVSYGTPEEWERDHRTGVGLTGGQIIFKNSVEAHPVGASRPLAGVVEVTWIQGLRVPASERRTVDDTYSEIRRRGMRDRADQAARELFPGVQQLEVLSEGRRALSSPSVPGSYRSRRTWRRWCIRGPTCVNGGSYSH